MAERSAEAVSAALPISIRSLKSRNQHSFLVTEFLTSFWASEANPSFVVLTGMKFGSQICVASPEAVLALTKDYLHVQTRQRCSHGLSTQTGADFAGAKHKPPQLPVENPGQGLRFVICLDVALSHMFPGSCTGLPWVPGGRQGEDGRCS